MTATKKAIEKFLRNMPQERQYNVPFRITFYEAAVPALRDFTPRQVVEALACMDAEAISYTGAKLLRDLYQGRMS